MQIVDLNEPIDTSLDALVVMAPREPFTDWMLFNIDQYMMNGGKLSMFMNWYRADLQTNQQAAPYNLNINGLLNNYGIGLGEDLISDIECAVANVQRRQGFITISQPIEIPYFPTIYTFNHSHIITRDLQQVQMFYPSSVDTTLAAERGYVSKVLLYSSTHTHRDTGPYVFLNLWGALKQLDFSESNIPVAAFVTGKFKSFFAESGPPEKDSSNEKDSEDEKEQVYDGTFKTESDIENRLILVGDGNVGLDMHIGQDGFLFIQNVIDWLIQSEDLIAIRSKQIPMKPLKELPDYARKFFRWINLIGPTILIIVVGISLWQVRRIKNRAEML